MSKYTAITLCIFFVCCLKVDGWSGVICYVSLCTLIAFLFFVLK